jgi:NAD(P)-dependent dehydrogenase (short-subunit alcohol dehydrogenase family)
VVSHRTNRVGVVVGAAGGIGSAVARALAGSCDRMLLFGRRREALEAVALTVGDTATVVAGDVGTAGGRDDLLAAVDGTIAWAVVASGVPLARPLVELSENEIETTFVTNLIGPTLLIRRLLQREWRPPASLVVVGSISASRSLPNRAVYASTKAGLEHLARTLAAEVAGSGVRVNVVSPGVIATPFLGAGTSTLDRWARDRVPLGRLGSADEVAAFVRYAVLEAPAYLTGARLVLDGGAEALA